MIYKIDITLTTTFVGSRKLNSDNIRNIARINDADPKLFTKRIRELCYKYATEELGIWDYQYDSIKIDGVLKVNPEDDHTKIHIRKFYSAETHSEKQESFESYPVGTRMSFSVYVTPESHLTKDLINQMFTYIGKYDGISQFGINWGYGKYDITNITEAANV